MVFLTTEKYIMEYIYFLKKTCVFVWNDVNYIIVYYLRVFLARAARRFLGKIKKTQNVLTCV